MLDNCMKKKPWHRRIPLEFYTAWDKLMIGLLLVAVSLHSKDFLQAVVVVAAAANFYLVIHYVLRYINRRRRRVVIHLDKIQFPEVKNMASGMISKDIVSVQPMTGPDVFMVVEKVVKVKVE